MTSTAEVYLSCTMNHDFNRSLIENIHHVRVEHKWKLLKILSIWYGWNCLFQILSIGTTYMHMECVNTIMNGSYSKYMCVYSVNPGPCLTQSFSGSGSRSSLSFEMNNFWTICHYMFKETAFVYNDMVKVF